MNEIKPIFLLAGGNFHTPNSMVPSIARALKECGLEKPRVAYLGVASGDNLFFYGAIKSLLHEAEAGEVFLLRLAKTRVDLASVKRALETSDAIFISGGEVDDGMRWLERHGLVDFLRELRSQGKLFIGVSAGSIMMGTHWVRWKKPNDDATAELFDCLGFAPTTFDTHAEDEDWKELKIALQLQGPGAHGYGIPREGMVSVDNQGQMVALEKTLLCYVNNEGQVQKEDCSESIKL